MTGLRAYVRDARLPARAGEPRLCAPTEEEILEIVRSELLHPGAPRVTRATLEFARWKIGVATTVVFRLHFEDGRDSFVTWKRHLGEKAADLAVTFEPDEHALAAETRLAPFHADPATRTVVTSFPTDRALPGLGRVLDLQRTCRFLSSAGLFEGERMRWRRSQAQVLRYKPERRAVLRLDVLTRTPEHEMASHGLIARVHEPDRVAGMVALRRAFDAQVTGVGPRLLAADERVAVTFEEWLSVRPCDATHFLHGNEAAELLARLHGTALPSGAQASPRSRQIERELFRVDEDLVRTLDGFEFDAPESGLTTWVHGDFHPDQVARLAEKPGWTLLDWDELSVGDPLRDVASWVTDALAAGVGTDPESAAGEFLARYLSAGGVRIDADLLRAHVAVGLVERAAGAIRRLEASAVEKARRYLSLACDLRPVGACKRPRRAFDRALVLATRSTGVDVALHVRRAEISDDGAVVLTVEDEALGSRWFRWHGDEGRELLLSEETQIPGARSLALAARAGAATILAWRPGRRLVARVATLDGSEVRKAFKRGRVARIAAAHGVVARGLGRGLLRVPRIVRVDAEFDTITYEHVRGEELSLNADRHLELLGQALSRLQAVPAQGLAEHTRADELRLLDRARTRHCAAVGPLPAEWEALRARLDVSSAPQGSVRVLAHRDLHDGQMLFDGRDVLLLDLDLAARAEPELDVANLIVHLRLCALQGVRAATPESVERSEHAFIAGLGLELDRRALDWYSAATALRLALVYATRPRWAHLVPALVDEARRFGTEFVRA